MGNPCFARIDNPDAVKSGMDFPCDHYFYSTGQRELRLSRERSFRIGMAVVGGILLLIAIAYWSL